MRRILSFTVLTGAYFFGLASVKEPGASAHALHNTPEWVTRSDQNAKLLLEVDARFYPESAASLGISDLDEQTIDLKAKFEERHGEATKQAIIELEKRLEQEKDNSVRQDLDILIKGARSEIRGREIRKKYFENHLIFLMRQSYFHETRHLYLHIYHHLSKWLYI